MCLDRADLLVTSWERELSEFRRRTRADGFPEARLGEEPSQYKSYTEYGLPTLSVAVVSSFSLSFLSCESFQVCQVYASADHLRGKPSNHLRAAHMASAQAGTKYFDLAHSRVSRVTNSAALAVFPKTRIADTTGRLIS